MARQSRSATPEAVQVEYIDPWVKWELPVPAGQPASRPFDRWYAAWHACGYYRTHQTSDRPAPSLFRDALAVDPTSEQDVRRAASTITPSDGGEAGEALVADLTGLMRHVGPDQRHHLHEGLADDLAATAAHAIHSGRQDRDARDKAREDLPEAVQAAESALTESLDPALSHLAERLGAVGEAMMARKLRDWTAGLHSDLQAVRRDQNITTEKGE